MEALDYEKRLERVRAELTLFQNVRNEALVTMMYSALDVDLNPGHGFGIFEIGR